MQISRVNNRPWIQTSKLAIGLLPAIITLAVSIAVVTAVLISSNGDGMALVQVGSRFESHDPNGTWGYDGQFYYYIARNPTPAVAAHYLDIPAYRYQRILFPVLARVLSMGNQPAIPWAMVFIGLISQAVGTWMVAKLLDDWGVSVWYALIYGLWIGFELAVRSNMAEPLAFGLAAGAMLSNRRDKPLLCWLLLALSLFTKEVTCGFILAIGLDLIWHRRWRHLAGMVGVTLLPYAIFQGWLLVTFGRFGISSGGALATPFEIIPYMGLIRMLANSTSLLTVLAIALVPVAVIPSIWGIWASLKKLIALEINPEVLALIINAASIAILPLSTFHDIRGTARFLCGLNLAVLLFAARYQNHRVLKWGWLWLSLDILLLLIF